MQMAVNHDIDGFGIDAVSRNHFRKGIDFRRQSHALASARFQLISAAGFNQNGVFASAYEVTVERNLNAVQFVRGGLETP